MKKYNKYIQKSKNNFTKSINKNSTSNVKYNLFDNVNNIFKIIKNKGED